MDIRYCYLSSTLITKLEKNLPYLSRDDIQYDERTSIIDFALDFASVYGDDCLPDLADILKCKAIDEYVPVNQLGSDANKWIEWLQKVYIPSEPKYLGPGAMSNAPDRLDGFHTYNRCCRTKQDSGRSKENLKSYATDRRAFELWVDGNWVTANKAKGRGMMMNPSSVLTLTFSQKDGWKIFNIGNRVLPEEIFFPEGTLIQELS